MEWNKIGLMFSLSRFKTYVNITTSTDCYLVPGSIGDFGAISARIGDRTSRQLVGMVCLAGGGPLSRRRLHTDLRSTQIGGQL